MSIKTGTGTNLSSGGGGATPDIQTVLSKGHVATGTPPLLFDNGTQSNQLNALGISLRDGTGAGVDIDVTDITVADSVGNKGALFVPGDGTVRVLVQEVKNNTTLEQIGDRAMGTCYHLYRRGVNFMKLIFGGGGILGVDTSVNFPAAGGNQNVAYISNVPVLVAQSVNISSTGAVEVVISIPHGLGYKPRFAVFTPNDSNVATMLGAYGTTRDPINVNLNTVGVLFNTNLIGTLFTYK